MRMEGEILRSKSTATDGVWSSVGSHVLNHRSLHQDPELNNNIYDSQFGSGMAGVFLAISKDQNLYNEKRKNTFYNFLRDGSEAHYAGDASSPQ